MRIFFVLLTLVVLSNASYASIAGKGLYCNIITQPDTKLEQYKKQFGLAFNETEVVAISYKLDRDTISFGIVKHASYSTTEKKINFQFNSYPFRGSNQIDRSSLVVEESPLNLGLEAICNVYDDFKSLNKRLNEEKKELQSGYNLKISKNAM